MIIIIENNMNTANSVVNAKLQNTLKKIIITKHMPWKYLPFSKCAGNKK